jgi:2-polyprenyl-3-methyl-5-hydroxy-6-metoxy-1,4-benzoquinol methylase
MRSFNPTDDGMDAEGGTLVGQEAFSARSDIVAIIPRPAGRVLDIGCGPGLTGEAILRAGAAEVWGVERDPRLAADARARLSRVVCSDLEQTDLTELPSHYFDVIVYGDVLEHLVDPWSVLQDQRRLLRPGGYMVASIPNVRHVRVITRLVLRGQWTYTAEGSLSIGHLRFFTTKTMRELIVGAGYSIERETANYGPIGRRLKTVSLGLLDDFVAFQRLFLARAA